MIKHRLYRFRKPKQYGKYQVMFHHIPNKWISTGTDDMAEAVLFAEERLKKDLIIGNAENKTTLKDFCYGIFDTEIDSHNIYKRNQRYGRNYSQTYYLQKKGCLNNYILPKFGSYLLTAITDIAIENWLLDIEKLHTYKDTFKMSDAFRNKILITFRLILDTAKREGLVTENVANNVQMFNDAGTAREVFTKEELAEMFPQDDDRLIYLWGSLMWAVYFLVLRDTGFRPSEISALSLENYYPNLHGLYSKNSVDCTTKKIKQSIKTTSRGQNYKVGLLTEQTERLLQKLAEEKKAKNETYFFTLNNRFLGCDSTNKHFKEFCPVELKGRTQYCLRHSFNTDLEGEIEPRLLNELMAHTAKVDCYDHRTPEKILQQLQPVRQALEKRQK